MGACCRLLTFAAALTAISSTASAVTVAVPKTASVVHRTSPPVVVTATSVATSTINQSVELPNASDTSVLAVPGDSRLKIGLRPGSSANVFEQTIAALTEGAPSRPPNDKPSHAPASGKMSMFIDVGGHSGHHPGKVVEPQTRSRNTPRLLRRSAAKESLFQLSNVEGRDRHRTEKSARVAQRGAASAASGHGSSAGIFGLRDTCYSLHFFGFTSVDSCRDTNSPSYDPNCRCERHGTALPAKFCTIDRRRSVGVNQRAVKGDHPLEAEARVAFSRSAVRGVTNHADVLLDEAYGSCDACCARTRWVATEVIVAPLLFLCCMCCCCGGACHAFRRSSRRLHEAQAAHEKLMVENLQAQALLASLTSTPSLVQTPEPISTVATLSQPQVPVSSAVTASPSAAAAQSSETGQSVLTVPSLTTPKPFATTLSSAEKHPPATISSAEGATSSEIATPSPLVQSAPPVAAPQAAATVEPTPAPAEPSATMSPEVSSETY